MPNYKHIKQIADDTVRNRVVNKLLQLRQKIRAEIPPKTTRETLLLATWNIREFKDNRLPESYYYISEIIDAFDFVAIQEVSSDLAGLEKLMTHLGRDWDYIVTDATQGSAGGGERMAFVYDRRKITFLHIAGEIVLPESKGTEQLLQFARTPFLAAFQAGWFRFMICTVHIFYGDERPESEGMQRRIDEIDLAAKWLKRKAKNENANYILLGDFNIVDTTHVTMQTLEKNGFYIPSSLKTKPTDLGQTKHYDQISFQVRDKDMLIFDKRKEAERSGAFCFQEAVFCDDEMPIYRSYFEPKVMEGKTEPQINQYYLSKWRTFQMSDHLPMWVELKIDFSDQYLMQLPDEDPHERGLKIKH